MLKKLLEFLKDKRILILGVGLQGKSTYDFLRRHFPDKKLFIADKNVYNGNFSRQKCHKLNYKQKSCLSKEIFIP